ncbi:hypothetical protein N879_16895 [Alcaligenes sp. EGD-AK7]|nr:hypothetical protein C660_11036 [Alcaligenes sp. HPC1271]ERT55098.1 hypothetical protein N879_16895 [Alcaligenes sp. EGD-AK7]
MLKADLVMWSQGLAMMKNLAGTAAIDRVFPAFFLLGPAVLSKFCLLVVVFLYVHDKGQILDQ